MKGGVNMKLVNYKRGYNNIFDCSIHGTIYMNSYEFTKIVLYIQKYKRYFSRSLFEGDINRKIHIKNGYMVNIRVNATEALAKHWGLKNYKRGNYQLCIKNY